MIFLYPGWLWLLVALVPIASFAVIKFRRHEKSLNILSGPVGKDALRFIYGVKTFLLALTLSLFILFSALSLTEPIGGQEPVHTDARGLDVCLLMDVSRSMLTEDVSGSRLNAAKDIVYLLLKNYNGMRFSLIVFKGDAFTLVPLTEDIASVENFLPYLGPGIVSTPGSNLENALRAALDSFPAEETRNRVVLLFTDGETLSGDYSLVLESFRERNIPIHVLGMGTPQGGLIPLGSGEVVKDRKGNPVTSELNETRLREIAKLSYGSYYGYNQSYPLQTILSDLEELKTTAEQRGIRYEPQKKYRFFLFPAILFLILHFMIRYIRWKDIL